jgi:hypothetical protein
MGGRYFHPGQQTENKATNFHKTSHGNVVIVGDQCLMDAVIFVKSP